MVPGQPPSCCASLQGCGGAGCVPLQPVAAFLPAFIPLAQYLGGRSHCQCLWGLKSLSVCYEVGEMSTNRMDNPGVAGQLAGLKKVGATRWGNPSSVLAAPVIREEVCPGGPCWEKDAEGQLNPVRAHTAPRRGTKRGANTCGGVPCCPLRQTLGSRAGVGRGDEAVAPALTKTRSTELVC